MTASIHGSMPTKGSMQSMNGEQSTNGLQSTNGSHSVNGSPVSVGDATPSMSTSAPVTIQPILLAGGIRRAPLHQELGRSILRLPVSERHTLLTAWLAAIRALPGAQRARIVVSEPGDRRDLAAHLQELAADGLGADAEVVVEPAPWRGTAGTLRDVTSGRGDGAIVLLAEAHCLPPRDLRPLVSVLAESTSAAAVGVGDGARPAGAYAFRRSALELVPAAGFYDVKEQLLPSLFAEGCAARSVRVTGRVYRLRDRASYLAAVAAASGSAATAGRMACVARWGIPALVPASARLIGPCFFGRGVEVGERVLVHDSVILDCASIGAGAVVVRSVVGAGARIAPGRVVRDAVVPFEDLELRREGRRGAFLSRAGLLRMWR